MKKIIRFTASWCAPCKALAKVLEEVKTTLPIEVIDIDENSELAAKFNVRGVPTMVLLENDKEVKRKVGMGTKEKIESWIND